MRSILIAVACVGVLAGPTVWGGDHVEMEVTERGAHVEFDCAHGTIDQPLHVDANGAFKVPGTFTAERGGPIRDGDAPRTAKATYAGTIKGDTMSVRVVVSGQDPGGETYVLTRKSAGKPDEVPVAPPSVSFPGTTSP